MPTNLPLPPILRTPGLKLTGLRADDQGNQYLIFTTPRRKEPVMVAVRVVGPGGFVYVYTVIDHDTHTMTTYVGPYGDPTKDKSELDGITPPKLF
jgi:hypothetical protein